MGKISCLSPPPRTIGVSGSSPRVEAIPESSLNEVTASVTVGNWEGRTPIKSKTGDHHSKASTSNIIVREAME